MRNVFFTALVAIVSVAVVAAAIALLALLDLPPWALTTASIGLPALLLALFLGWSWLMDVIRTRRLRRLAIDLGFAFSESVSPGELADCSDLPLFQRGAGRHARNRLEGEWEGQRVVVMDFEYRTGTGRHVQSHRQTVVLVPGRHVAREAPPDSPRIETGQRCTVVYRPEWMERTTRVPAFVRDALGRLRGLP